ncbi:hypothetical protein RDI58_007648 [Solanum bulbocastanum]|uniref:Uncharacterized protein n=1 Tax=Solanum bulbocastanum TaxID=147425 RepID=A0AAN8TUC4_SOLBU
MSFFERWKYCGHICELYVKHLIDELFVDPSPILLENVSHENRKESGSTFNKGDEQNDGPNIVVSDETLSGEDPFTTTPQTTSAATRTTSITTPINTINPFTIDPATYRSSYCRLCYCKFNYCSPTTIDTNDIDVGPVGSDLVEEDGSDTQLKIALILKVN